MSSNEPVQESTRTDREFRLVLPPEVAEAIRLGLVADGAEAGAETLVLRVYMDLPGLPLGIQALSNPRDCLKVSATREPDGSWRVETKEEQAELTRRTWINVRAQHLRFAFGSAGRELLPAMPAGLQPAFACAYERTTYVHPEGWRAAVDRGLRIHLADFDGWTGQPMGTLPNLGPCLARQRSTVVCVQHGPRGLPAWLKQLEAERAVPFSRFAIGVRQVRAALRAGEMEAGAEQAVAG